MPSGRVLGGLTAPVTASSRMPRCVLLDAFYRRQCLLVAPGPRIHLDPTFKVVHVQHRSLSSVAVLFPPLCLGFCAKSLRNRQGSFAVEKKNPVNVSTTHTQRAVVPLIPLHAACLKLPSGAAAVPCCPMPPTLSSPIAPLGLGPWALDLGGFIPCPMWKHASRSQRTATRKHASFSWQLLKSTPTEPKANRGSPITSPR